VHRHGRATASMDRVVGVMKAYSTRVGDGALPRRTRNWRRCFTISAANSARQQAQTPLWLVRRCGDSLRGHDQRHRRDRDHQSGWTRSGRSNPHLCWLPATRKTAGCSPCDAAQLANCEPVYEEVAGWNTSIHTARKFSQLPLAARNMSDTSPN
jgi:Adenylosuccinate synthase